MLVDRLLAAAGTHPRKLAVADPIRQLDYGQLTTFARIMRDIIVSESRCPRVGIMLPGSTACCGTLFGCFWAERVAVPLNFLLQPAELRRIVEDAELDLVLTVKHFEGLADSLPVRCLFLEQLGLKLKFLTAKFKRTPAPPQVSEDQTAVILYTSGTSGDPKGVDLSYGNLASNCRDCLAHAQIQPVHTLLSVLPPFHIFGLTATTLLPIWGGMTVHYIPRFSPVRAVKTIEEQRISVLMAIPSMYVAIQRVKHTTAETLASLFLAISGGEPLQAGTRQAFQEMFNVSINEGYGLTETAPVISIDLPWNGRAGSVGRPIPNCQVRIVSPEGQVLGCDQDGEIQVKGPGVMKGYYKRPQESEAAFAPGGWFKSGDQGRLDQDGFLYITGRIKEMMIIGGENVFPGEIEEVLSHHDGVEEVAVIGVADATRGEVAVAFVIPREGVQLQELELRTLCRDQLAGFKVPRHIYFNSDLPRGPTGKILKRALHDMVSAGS